MPTLFELTDTREALVEALLRVEEEHWGDDDDEVARNDHDRREENLAEALADIDATLVTRADDIGWVVRDLEAQAEAHKALADEIAAKAKRATAAAQRLKGYVQEAMERGGLDRIEGQTWKLALHTSPPSIKEVEAVAAVAAGYGEMVPKVDGRAIIADWRKDPDHVAGFAIVTQGRHLRIR